MYLDIHIKPRNLVTLINIIGYIEHNIIIMMYTYNSNKFMI